jgi:hypothetical protein
MNDLSNDCTRCENTTCHLKKSCLRFIDKGNNKYMWYSKFKPVKSICIYQIKNKV